MVRNIRKKKEKSELEVKLERCRETLHLQLTSTTRSETLRQLERVLKSGELQKNELVSLQYNVDTLRSALDAKHLDTVDLDAIRSIFNRSDQALAKVYSNLILDGLRYEKMNDRFGDVMDAHCKTFDWIMGPTNADSEEYGFDTEGEDSVDDDHSNKANEHEDRLENEREDGRDFASAAENLNDDETENEGESEVGIGSEEAECDRDEKLREVARDAFLNWLEHGNEIFHVSGKPGAGKSTLMKYLCEHDRTKELLEKWSGNKLLVFAKFFFWRPGSEYQKSLKGLRRSLLHCILDQCPELIPKIFPTQWENAKYHSTIRFDEDEVKRALDRIVKQDDVYDQRNFVFFIDGLDEFEGDHAEIVRLLISWVSTRSDIKICLSSREYLIFQERFAKYPKMKLHELTRDDISIYVRDTLVANEDFGSLQIADSRIADLREIIVYKSEGVFLWVSLAVRTLEQGLLAQDHFEDLGVKVDALPSELNDLFQFLFESIKRGHQKDRRTAMHTLAIVAEYQRLQPNPVELIHYIFFEDFERDSNFAIKLPIYDMDEHVIRERLKRSRKRVYEHCKGFLEVVDGGDHDEEAHFRGQYVRFIHRSVTEFLQEKTIRQAMAPDVDGFDFVSFRSQSLVAELKVLELGEAYFTQDYRGPSSRFVFDLERYVMHDCDLAGGGSRLCDILIQLINMVNKRVEEDKTASWVIYRRSSLQIRNSDRINYEMNSIVRHPSMQVRFCAMKYGVYQFLSTDIATGLKLCPDQELDEIFGVALFSSNGLPLGVGRIPASRLVKVIVYGFENGVSVNSSGGFKGSTSCWRTVLFYSVLGLQLYSKNRANTEYEPLLRAFLLYGAESQLWLKFGPRYCGNKSSIEIVRVILQFGNNQEEPLDPFYVLDHPFSRSKGAIDLAETRGGLLSFEDIVGYWFPQRGKVLKELIHRNIARGGVPDQEELNELKAMPGWDLDIWQGITSEKDRPLFQEHIDESQLEKNGFSVLETPNPVYGRKDRHPKDKPLIELFEEALRLKNEAPENGPDFYHGYIW